ncbi:MAG: amidohydrolase [Alphaproteobacteria bacterium]|nr:amidohydrolase [Alphaproteobacteria bacterium]
MAVRSRRSKTFAILAVVAAILLLVRLWLAPPEQHDEILFFGGDIETVTSGRVEALLVRDGRIAAIGTLETVSALTSNSAQQIDLAGRTLLPGLIEPHTHPVATAQFGATVDVSGFTHQSRAAVMTTLKEAADDWTPNGWVIAFGWDPVMVDDLEPPTLEELDALAPDKPLVILTQMMHDAYANSAALEVAGITATTPDPKGGEFVKDETGKLTGVVREVAAIGALFSKVPSPPEGSMDLLVNLQLGAYARAGFTTIAAAGLVGSAPDQIGMVKRLSAARDAPVQLAIYGLPHQVPSAAAPEKPSVPGALIGVKYWMDGSPYAGGAAVEDPYEDSALTRERLHLKPGHSGALNYELETFRMHFTDYHRRGFQIAVHVQGERAVDRVLDVVEGVLKAHPRKDHRHRLEHNALITNTQLKRAESLGVTTSFFVDHVTFYGHRLPEIFGADRTARYMPTRSALDTGMRISLHSDNPATPIGPFRTFAAAVTRQPLRGGDQIAPDQALTRLEALRAMTINAAWQLGLEAERGSLDIGKAADLVIVSSNPLTTSDTGLAAIKAEATWIAGRPVDRRKTTSANAALLWGTLKAIF